MEGHRDILGLWAGEHGDGEGAKYWMRVLSEIKNRGTQDCLIVVCDGLKGLPEAITTVWPQTIVQTCVVHYADIRIMPSRQRMTIVFPVQEGGTGYPSRHNPGCARQDIVRQMAISKGAAVGVVTGPVED